jgi:YggT family protein
VEAFLLTDIFFTLLSAAVSFLIWSIVLSAIISILLALNVLDSRNRFVWSINDFLYRITDPVLRPMRRRIPTINGVDLSPWITLVLLQVVVLRVLDYLHVGIRTGFWPPLF